jgi:hypothetical protein
MKLRYLFFSAFACLFLLIINASAQGVGCSAGKRAGIYYTDCFPKANVDVDDTQRLKNAINTIVGSSPPNSDGTPTNTGSGKLIFNEGTYQISDALPLNSNIIIEGTSSSAGATTTSSRINFTLKSSTVNRSVFFLNGGITEVSIRDIGLSVTPVNNKPPANTYGILAKNTNLYSRIDANGKTVYVNSSSIKFQFSNIRVEGFSKGIYVVPSMGDMFQFDSVRLDHASFINCDTAIEIDASNSGWAMTNVNILSTADQDGIVIKRGGYISMNLIVGNGLRSELPTDPQSGTFIKILKSSNLSVQNSAVEYYRKTLDIDLNPGNAKLFPIALINNSFSDTVSINNARVISTGNFYGNNYRVALPVIKGKSDVISIGDGFCWSSVSANSQFCKDSKFVIEGTSATLQKMGGAEDPTIVDEKDLYGNPTAARPALKIIEPSVNKTLLELGNYNSGGEFVYRLKRDDKGRLTFVASQGLDGPSPWIGYNFDGPVRLKSYQLSQILGLGTSQNGDMLYCLNCATNSTPCSPAATGGGALAIFTNNQWSCK